MSKSKSTWKPGTSGNPKGRPKRTPEGTQREIERALAQLLAMSKNRKLDPKTRLKATLDWLGYMLGRPAQAGAPLGGEAAPEGSLPDMGTLSWPDAWP